VVGNGDGGDTKVAKKAIKERELCTMFVGVGMILSPMWGVVDLCDRVDPASVGRSTTVVVGKF
jgi:hypothetical protein